MSVVKDIYESLETNFGMEREVSVEDWVRYACTHRHYLELLGRERPPIEGKQLLLRVANNFFKARLREHFYARFGLDFIPGSTQTINGIIYEFFGSFASGSLIEVVFVSSSVIENGKVPWATRIAAAAKAHALGKSRVWILLIGQSSQDWLSFTLEGDFEPIHTLLQDDAAYISENLKTSIPEEQLLGLASEDDCKICPFQPSCKASRISDFQALDTGLVTTKNDPWLTTELDDQLSKLSDRQKIDGKRISPSHFTGGTGKSCDRAVAYKLLGKPEKEKIHPLLQRIFLMGHSIHHAVQIALGWAFPDFQEEVKAEYPTLKIQGSCDGAREGWICEIKSISETGFNSMTKPKQEHLQQATIYARMLQVETIEYLYVNKATGEIKSFVLEPNKDFWHELALRATKILKAVDAYETAGGTLPPKIENKHICSQCSFSWLCRPETLRPLRP